MIWRACLRRSSEKLLYRKPETTLSRLYWHCRAESFSTCHSSRMASNGTDYSTWSSEKLIDRVTKLEQQLKEANGRFYPSFLLWLLHAYENEQVSSNF